MHSGGFNDEVVKDHGRDAAVGGSVPPGRAVQVNKAKPTLGSILHALRARNGWTLKEMSARTGVPFSTLSKVEHDRLTLTYDKLQQISERLQIPMSDLFAEPDSGPKPVMARRSVGSLERALQVSTKTYDYYFFCTELRGKRMLPVLTRLRARSLADFGELVRHAGEEFIYVLEGRVAVHTEFYAPVTLGVGEAVYIDSNMGHAYLLDEGCDAAVILGACSSPQLHQEALRTGHRTEPDSRSGEVAGDGEAWGVSAAAAERPSGRGL